MPRARHVVWARQAKRDLLDIWRYYARVASPEIADNILRGIERASEAIGKNPLARRARDDLMAGLRPALVSPHTIFYRVRSPHIEVVRVLHEPREFPPSPPPPSPPPTRP